MKLNASKLSAIGAIMALALGDKAPGIARVPSSTKTGRKMVHAKGAVQRDTPPALTTEQSAWNAQVEAKRKAKGKS